ncbi:MAG: hypothetical protein JWP97_244 [Labilithrix sp.]|nr:hypothetical protein [Labilithrix sp.]
MRPCGRRDKCPIMIVPRSNAAFRRASRVRRLWWGLRPNAIELARAARVDADVEASIRNGYQLSRTWLYAFIATLPLTIVNVALLHKPFNLESSWAALALMVGQVGAIYSLSRSNETRAYLGEMRVVLHEVAARATLASLTGYAREVEQCETEKELRALASLLLVQLRRSRLFPADVDAFSVWARDDVRGEWRIVSAFGASQETVLGFAQPILEAETAGAGVVANLAATADESPVYYQASADRPPKPWFVRDPARKRDTQTLAVFLLPDEDGVPIGAFSLTSAKVDALEVAAGKFSERLSLNTEQCSLTLVGVARRAHLIWSQAKA